MKGRDVSVGDTVIFDGTEQRITSIRGAGDDRLVMTDQDFRRIVRDDDDVETPD